MIAQPRVCDGRPSATGCRARPLRTESPVEPGAVAVRPAIDGGSSWVGAHHAAVVDFELANRGTVEGSAGDPFDQRRLDRGMRTGPWLTRYLAVGRPGGRFAARAGAALQQKCMAPAPHLYQHLVRHGCRQRVLARSEEPDSE